MEAPVGPMRWVAPRRAPSPGRRCTTDMPATTARGSTIASSGTLHDGTCGGGAGAVSAGRAHAGQRACAHRPLLPPPRRALRTVLGSSGCARSGSCAVDTYGIRGLVASVTASATTRTATRHQSAANSRSGGARSSGLPPARGAAPAAPPPRGGGDGDGGGMGAPPAAAAMENGVGSPASDATASWEREPAAAAGRRGREAGNALGDARALRRAARRQRHAPRGGFRGPPPATTARRDVKGAPPSPPTRSRFFSAEAVAGDGSKGRSMQRPAKRCVAASPRQS
jgi:hypothetical protein